MKSVLSVDLEIEIDVDCPDWGSVTKQVEMALVEKGIVKPERERECAGEGRCHGSLSWCSRCDVVSHTCEMNGRCDTHPKCHFPGCLILNCFVHEDFDEIDPRTWPRGWTPHE